MSEHSPTPWAVDGPGDIIDADRHMVLHSMVNNPRIVACVNACEGLTEDDMEHIADLALLRKANA